MTVLIQRPLKGSRISSFYPVKSLPALSALDSAFQLQEYISLLIRADVHDVERIVSIAGKNASEGREDGEAKEEKDVEKDGASGINVDEACWVYEQLRRLAQDLSHPLITMLQQECTRSTCPEMKAGEWLYLCVAHGNEGAMEQCCAIDYILHTLDSATALLNSPRAFPSRLSVPPTSHRHFSSLARRLGRIFAHAYFHHREAFEQAEAESSLYARFLALTSRFDLVPAEFLVIPPRLTSMGDDERGGRADHVKPPRLLAASLDPRRSLGASDERAWPGDHHQLGHDRGTSPPGPAGERRNESPRKFGRNRTDTMVYSEAFSVAEELAKSDLSEIDIDREIAAERAAAAAEADLPRSSAPVLSPAHTVDEATVDEAGTAAEEQAVPTISEPEPEVHIAEEHPTQVKGVTEQLQEVEEVAGEPSEVEEVTEKSPAEDHDTAAEPEVSDVEDENPSEKAVEESEEAPASEDEAPEITEEAHPPAEPEPTAAVEEAGEPAEEEDKVEEEEATQLEPEPEAEVKETDAHATDDAAVVEENVLAESKNEAAPPETSPSNEEPASKETTEAEHTDASVEHPPKPAGDDAEHAAESTTEAKPQDPEPATTAVDFEDALGSKSDAEGETQEEKPSTVAEPAQGS